MGLIIFIVLYLGYMTLVALPYFEMLKTTERYGGGKFQFSTSDLLAISLGLVPTAWLTSLEQRSSHHEIDVGRMLAAFLFYGSSQVTGMVMFIATNVSPSRKFRSPNSSALSIFFGALAGLFMPLLGVFLIFFNRRGSQRRPETDKKKAKAKRQKIFKSTAPQSPVSQTTADPPSRPDCPS